LGNEVSLFPGGYWHREIGQWKDEIRQWSEQMLNMSDIGDEGKASGVVFLYSVPIGAENEMKKLKSPLPLLLHVDEKNGFIDLANSEFKILVSCKTLEEALEEAGLQFSDSFNEYNDPSIPMTTAAKEFGKKLMNAVWL
jgi:hypothetical protein